MKSDQRIPHFGHQTKEQDLLNQFHQKMLEKGFTFVHLGFQNGRFINYQTQVMWEGFQMAHESIPLIKKGHFVLASMETGFPYFTRSPRIHRHFQSAHEEMVRLKEVSGITRFGMYQFVMTNEDIEKAGRYVKAKINTFKK